MPSAWLASATSPVAPAAARSLRAVMIASTAPGKSPPEGAVRGEGDGELRGRRPALVLGAEPDQVGPRVGVFAARLAETRAFGLRHRPQRRHLVADLVDVGERVQRRQDRLERGQRAGRVTLGHLDADLEDAQLQLVGAVRVEQLGRILPRPGCLPLRRPVPLSRDQLTRPRDRTLLCGQ